jgi:hypothetical protein
VKQKVPTFQTRAPLQSITTTAPFQMVSLDFVRLEKSSGGYEYILVIMDQFTRYAQAYATRNKSAKTVAEKYNDYILRFGFLEKLHHDQRGEFENHLFKQLEKLCGIGHSKTTPYHPQGNGQVERFNRTLLAILRTLPETQKSHWKDHLQKMVHAYNCTRHESTGFSPFYLLFGRHPRLPIDMILNLESESNESPNYREYVNNWSEAMSEEYKIANEKSSQSRAKGKKLYDRRIRSSEFRPGDRVLVRNMSKRDNPCKLRSHWEDKIHVVVTRRGEDSPVYTVKPESSDGPSRTLHRNMLLPCSSLPVEPLLNQKTPRRQRENTVPPSTRSTSQLESDEDELDGLTPLANDQRSGADVTDAVTPAQDGERRHDEIDNSELPAVGNPDVLALDEQQPTIPPPATENSAIPPPPMENTRPSRNRNPPPRLNYWTPGNPVTGISYPGSMNTIFGFVEPSHPGVMPFPPMNSIPYMWQPTPLPYYPFAYLGPHCPYCGTRFFN